MRGPFYEAVNPSANGAQGALVWYASDPESPCIIDGSESFSPVWTNQGNNRWRASYNRTRWYERSNAYHNNCTTGTCEHESCWHSHGAFHNGRQLKRIHAGSAPSSFNQGEVFFERGSGSYETPQYIWVRLDSDVDPNTDPIRIASNRKYLFDYSPHTQADGFYGGDTEATQTAGRNYIGLAGITFRYGQTIKQASAVSLRGQGWHFEHCAVIDCTGIGLGIHGDDHTLIDFQVVRNGQYGFRMDWANGCTLDKFRMEENNFHDLPSDWNAGGTKIESSGRTSKNYLRDGYVINNRGNGIWFDIDNGKGNPQQDAFLLKRIWCEGNHRGGLMIERTSRYIAVEDSVFYRNLVNVAGQSNQAIGCGIRFQAADQCAFLRCVSVNNGGHGWFNRAAYDGRAANNNHTIDYCAFVMNDSEENDSGGTTPGDQTPSEIFGGDGQSNTGNRETNRFNNVVVSNNRSNAVLFHDTENGSTSNPNTFIGWVNSAGSSNVTVEGNPGNVVQDYSSDELCYVMQSGYENYEPVFSNGHPKYLANWSPGAVAVNLSNYVPVNGYQLYEWSDPGSWVDIDVTTIANVGTGEADNAPGLKAHIDANSGTRVRYIFPSGTFNFGSLLHINRDEKRIIGNGMGSTIFNMTGSAVIRFQGYDGAESNCTVAPQRGDTTVQVVDASVFNSGTIVGETITIRETLGNTVLGSEDTGSPYNVPSPIVPESWAAQSYEQIVEVVAIDTVNNTITFTPPLALDYNLANTPQVKRYNNVFDSGIEGVTLDVNADTGLNALEFDRVRQCYARGVEVLDTAKIAIRIAESYQVEISGCVINGARDTGTGGNGYGVALELGSSRCNVFNCKATGMRHHWLIQSGASHNTLLYCVSADASAENLTDMSIHGHYCHHNLIEGCVFRGVVEINDFYTETNHNLLFRNRIVGNPNFWDGNTSSYAVWLRRNSICAIVGNRFNTTLGVRVFSNSSASLVTLNGNADAPHGIPDSMVYTSKPPYFNVSDAFPAFAGNMQNTIPAESL